MDIGAWLRSLGLSRYETAFSDNSIDADVLPDLTDGDLAQLGVNLGDRKRLAAVERAGKSLRDLRIAEVAELDLQINGGKVEAYRAKVKVSFKYEES